MDVFIIYLFSINIPKLYGGRIFIWVWQNKPEFLEKIKTNINIVGTGINSNPLNNEFNTLFSNLFLSSTSNFIVRKKTAMCLVETPTYEINKQYQSEM